jgi:TRAP transporter TAXI family solute receptor
MNHVVTVEGKGIKRVTDLEGKRVSTGAPGSGTEVIAFRILEAAGLNHEKDIMKDRLGASESAGALKDGKIDANLALSPCRLKKNIHCGSSQKPMDTNSCLLLL